MENHEQARRRRLSAYEREAMRIIDTAAEEAARLAAGLPRDPAAPPKPFDFNDYPAARERVARLIRRLNRRLYAALARGIAREWDLADADADRLVARVVGRMPAPPTPAQLREWLGRSPAAREAFLRRRVRGLDLSRRVWRIADDFRAEIEMAIDCALRDGTPALELAREIKQYLRHPDRLFRRVRDAHGNLTLSKNARNCHPGRGVYRSSHMNARRLAATEISIAYRAADHLRWQRMDFVVGIEIRLSNNHNCRGVPRGAFSDICDSLQGLYPKDFKFTGWHPHCRCYAVPILQTPEELEAGATGSRRAVRGMPRAFTDHMEANRARIAAAAARGTLPYFIRDNFTAAPDGSLTRLAPLPPPPAEPPPRSPHPSR